MKNNAYLYCDYEEFKPKTYHGFVIDYKKDGEFRVNTGKPYKDFEEILNKFHKKYPEISVAISSTVDNYLMDSNDKKLEKVVYKNVD